MKVTAARNLLPCRAPRSCASASNSTRNREKAMPPISRHGWKFSRTTTAPLSRQSPMPNAPPIISTRKPQRRSRFIAESDSNALTLMLLHMGA